MYILSRPNFLTESHTITLRSRAVYPANSVEVQMQERQTEAERTFPVTRECVQLISLWPGLLCHD